MPLGNSVAGHLIHPSLAETLRPALETLLGREEAFGHSIAIRRGATTLAEQKVRLAPIGRGFARERNSEGAQQDELSVFVIGLPTLDIAVSDRFNDGDGALYEVYFIRPNRQIQTVAEARLVGNG